MEKHRRGSTGDRLLTAGANVTVLALAAVALLLEPAVAGIVLGVVALVVATAELARRRRRTRADAEVRRCARRGRLLTTSHPKPIVGAHGRSRTWG